MDTTTNQVPAITSLKDAIAAILALQETVNSLQATVAELTKPKSSAVTEMTDDHARRILIGDLADKKHNDAATALGLSYGQVYSCRGEYTFKHIHKELKNRDGGFTNQWAKK